MSKLTKKINTVYLEPENFDHTRKVRDDYGSTSSYFNHLINKDRGVKTKFSGHWKPKVK